MTELVEAHDLPEVRAASDVELTDAAAVAESVITLARTVGRARARVLAAAAHDVEWSAHVLLKTLEKAGSMRASELADTMHADPSTVSRQVAALVRDGLVERRADPADGRASVLVLTAAADDVLAHHERTRSEFFATILADWSREDVAKFADMLHRFTDTFDHLNSTRIAERIAARDDRAGSTS